MRSHAKASPAGSTQCRSLVVGNRSRRWPGVIVALAAMLTLVVAPTAGATQFQRPFKESFGSAEQPSSELARLVAVDMVSGEVLVGSAESVSTNSGTISRFNPDGTAAPFSALGTATIDGKAGPGGKPCAEEPASCDQTPQNRLEVEEGSTRKGGIGSGQIAVSPVSGDIYVTQAEAGVVDIFSSAGKFQGQLSATASKSFAEPCGVAVDSTGTVYVAQNSTISKFVPTANPPVNADNTANFSLGHEGPCHMALGAGPSNGWIFIANHGGSNPGPRILKVNMETGEFTEFANGYQDLVAVDPTSGNPIAFKSGSVNQGENGSADFAEFNGSLENASSPVSRLVVKQSEFAGIADFAADAAGNVYVAYGKTGSLPSNILVYGAPAVVPTVTAEPASGVTGTKATLTGSVNPEGLEVSECVFEYGLTTNYETKVPCEGSIPTDSSSHQVHLHISGLEPNGETYHYRLAATNLNGTEESADQTFTTAHTVVTEQPDEIGVSTATLRGTVRPEGVEYSDCFFEYGLSSSPVFEQAVPCHPPASAIEADLSPHSINASITGLQQGTTYRVRLLATNAEGTLAGEELTFTTLGAPQITEVRALNADQDSATLEAKINPSGFLTHYYFEWGPTAAYGNRIPLGGAERPAGSGTAPVPISTDLSSLSVATTYHYRVVATNKIGTTLSADQKVETLDSCGLPDQRCFELVSPRDAGPVATPGKTRSAAEMHYQAAAAPGLLAYVAEFGFPDATKGAEILYLGKRSAGGWESTQLSSPIVAQNERVGTGAGSGQTQWLSDDLSCGFLESTQPLTPDPGTRLAIETGGENLYLRNSDGSYVAITKLPPENGKELSAATTEYFNPVVGSRDCGKVVFGTQYHYPGIAAVGSNRLYEWDEGVLRNVGIVPGPSGEVAVAATLGAGLNQANAVSGDGSRVFFTATRQTSSKPSEIGKAAVFVREDGGLTRDVSLSQTATADTGATYQYASADGSRVFFTANAGLTPETSPTGTDLYQYDLESSTLTDLSASHATGGAQVGGFIGASTDGSRVYFLARGQLVPGRGNTLVQNESASTYSAYSASGGVVSFVGTVRTGDVNTGVGIAEQSTWTSRVSPDGRFLLFASSANVTGYDSGGAKEAYVFDAEAGSEATACISCRQNGEASVAPPVYAVLASGGRNNPSHPPQSLVVREGAPRVLFSSLDRLAPGAVEGETNLYEWSHGQVFLLASEPTGSRQPGQEVNTRSVEFAGASTEGSDLYFSTPVTLNWEDGDGRSSVYDARIGGGFPEPPPAARPCEPRSEGSCQVPSPSGPSVVSSASSTFNGPGNVKPKAPSKKKHHKRHHRKRKARHVKHKRHENGNRRAGK